MGIRSRYTNIGSTLCDIAVARSKTFQVQMRQDLRLFRPFATTPMSQSASNSKSDTMKAWQWSSCSSTLEKALTLNMTAALPTSKRSLLPDESLIKVHAAALNPIDYKLVELPLVGRMAIPKPATPGLDFAGTIVEVGAEPDLKIGQKVFGKLEPMQQFGTLGEYVIGSRAGTVPLPDGIGMEAAATMGVCGLVTYQSLAPNIKAGDRVFINGGSGGTGTFAIQIAKALGCWVTTTCSEKNVQLCKDLGADEVIDYHSQDVAAALASSQKYDFVLDNVGADISLYWKSPTFTNPGAKYVQIGAQPSLPFVYDLAFRFLVPTQLGGVQRPFSFGMAATNYGDFTKLAELVAQGKVKPVIDEIFSIEDAPRAYEKLKTGRAKGKIIVRVRNEGL